MKKWNSFSMFTRRAIVTAVVVPALALMMSAASGIILEIPIPNSSKTLFYDLELCVICGACAENDPTGAFTTVVVDTLGTTMLRIKPNLLDEEQLPQVIEVCPTEAIRME